MIFKQWKAKENVDYWTSILKAFVYERMLSGEEKMSPQKENIPAKCASEDSLVARTHLCVENC